MRTVSVFFLLFIFGISLTGHSQNIRDDINGDWEDQQVILYNTPEAEVMVRVGDIDNLGFGWPTNFDPFTGASTPPHSYPFSVGPDDYEGTDRIMVITSYDGNPPSGQDGYTNGTSRPENLPRPIVLNYDLGGATVSSAVLQIFVDDFQAPVWGANYFVTLNDIQAPYIATQINSLVQTGPIGKLINVAISASQLSLVSSGSLAILFDDLTTGAGDGYAIDFVKLLVNPTGYTYTGIISGTVTEAATGNPISGAVVSASNLVNNTTDGQGNYTLENVPAGLINITSTAMGYEIHSGFVDLQDGQTVTYNIQMEEAFIPICDTLHYPFPGTPTIFTVASPNFGYVSGNNSYGDLAKADFFDVPREGKVLYKGLFEFGYVSIASGQDPGIEFQVWDNQGDGGLPGSVIGSTTIPISQIFDDVVNEQITEVTFDPPVDINGPFYLGLMLPTTEGDTLALITTDEGEVTVNKAYELWSDETWHAFSDPNAWSLSLTQAIYAVFCDKGIGIKEPANAFELLVYPNPARDYINIEFLDVLIGDRALVNIYDMLGNQVKSIEANISDSRQSIYIEDLREGLYILDIRCDGFGVRRKVVVE